MGVRTERFELRLSEHDLAVMDQRRGSRTRADWLRSRIHDGMLTETKVPPEKLVKTADNTFLGVDAGPETTTVAMGRKEEDGSVVIESIDTFATQEWDTTPEVLIPKATRCPHRMASFCEDCEKQRKKGKGK